MQSLDCPPRWSTPRRLERATYGGKIADIASALGTPLMAWQQHVADVALEVDPATGRLAYRQVVLTVPRQSGKTTLMLALVLLRALAMGGRQRIAYTAQSGVEARDKWQDDWLPILDDSPFAKTYRPRLTNGHEALLFRNGSIQRLIATTKKSGHGGHTDLAILDEAFAHADARLEQALSPAMITRAQPQLWVVSTAGTPEESPYLWGKVELGRQMADVGGSSAYFEWSAVDGMDPADEATWWSCMPALGVTQPVEAVRAEFEKMAINDFERAFLNRWKSGTSDPVIPLDRWADCLDRYSEPSGPVWLAFDVTPDGARSSIAACGVTAAGLAHVEALPDDCRAGTDWLPDRLRELKDRHHPQVIVCDPKGPANALLPDLRAVGIDVSEDYAGRPAPGSLVLVDSNDHAQACGVFFNRVMDRQIRHRDQPMLLSAIDGGKRRPLGDAWAWSRKASSVDISPLVAVTLAHWAYSSLEGSPLSVYEQRDLVSL